MEQQIISNVALWRKAVRFHLRYHVELLPVLPLLFIPMWTDCYHSIVIRRANENNGHIHTGEAVGRAFKLFPTFVSKKFGIFAIAYLWGLIPIIGWYKAYRFRIKWAMVSNVLVFEKLKGQSIYKRCDELANRVIKEKRSSALWVIPSLLFFLFLLLFLLGTSAMESSFFFWVSVVLSIYLFLPCSAVVNTLVYLSVTNKLPAERMKKKSVKQTDQ
jgi:uncharacterized integral membrane protein